MKTKSQKQAELKSLLEKLPTATISIFTTFAREGEKGLSVAQMQELKRALRALGSEYLVAKKSLVDIATKELKYDGADVYGTMPGSVGIVVGRDDAYAIAKALYQFAKKNQALQYFGAYYDGKFIDPATFAEMATMPSRDVLLAQLFGMMQYPLTELVAVLTQIADAKPAEATAAPAAPEAAPAPAPEETPAAPAAEEAPVAEAETPAAAGAAPAGEGTNA